MTNSCAIKGGISIRNATIGDKGRTSPVGLVKFRADPAVFRANPTGFFEKDL